MAETSARSWLRCYRCWSAGPGGAGPLRGHPQDRPRHRRARRSRRRAPGGRGAMPRLHARPASPRLQQRPRRADRGSLGTDDRRHAMGRILHRRRSTPKTSRPAPVRRRATHSPTPPSATTGSASSSPMCASTSTKTTRASSCTCSSSSTRARSRRPPRRSSPRARRTHDHLARRGTRGPRPPPATATATTETFRPRPPL